ncbi:hypothetical protein [Comamonas endophytica]|uniref:Uncharacterized protein n=1 Tax=Comamonas endophytica TaxID=2949090 RepID=A0ABY6G9V9_9BURK|nr:MULTISPECIES: hypothetical protein [unclassified Acidovorax]MCD2514223.1 hypothetical protein [Acidovorax sp. D4N7]UYG51362.1 hypothetical protein M9799_15060 [Acidovorax sp. 5MLIR]
MMNYQTIAAHGSRQPLVQAFHCEEIPASGVRNASARSLMQSESIVVDDGNWLVPWPADNLSPAAPSIAGAACSVKTDQSQLNMEVANRAMKFMTEAKVSAIQLDESCYQLLAVMNEAAGETMHLPHPDRMLPMEFGSLDTLQYWAQTMSRGLAAFQSNVDELLAAPAASAALAAVGMAATVGVPKSSLAVQSAATTGAAYLCAQALRKCPKLTNDKEIMSSLNAGLSPLNALLEQIEHRLAWLKGRHDVEARITTVQYARAQKLRNLRFEAQSVATAGNAAMAAPDRTVRVSDGGLRAQVLGLAAQAKTAFGTFFTHVGKALCRVYTFFVPGAGDGRRAAFLQEQEDAKRITPTLRALQSSAQDSLIDNKLSLEAQAMQRAIKAGVTDLEYSEARQRFIMGENLVRALMTAKVPSFGSMEYDGGEKHGGRHIVYSTLATSRSIAWYLDAIADLDAEARRVSPGTPQVKRIGNSLVVADPQRRLAGFLMSAPTAHTAIMAGRKDAALSTAITIDDHRAGMPGGMHSMQIESVVDEKSNTAGLRLSFTAQGDRPVYQPLTNEARVMDRMRTAPYMSGAPLPAASQDYSGWSVDRRAAHFQALKEQVRQEAIVFKADQRLLLDIAVPGMPQLIANYA